MASAATAHTHTAHTTPAIHCHDGQCAVGPKHPCYQNPKVAQVMEILQKISLVVLVVLAFYSEPEITGYFTAGGFVLGVCMYSYQKPDQKPDENHTESGKGCSVGLMGQLTGISLPPPIELAANIAIFYHHLEHCSDIFSALVGLNFGYKMGQLAAEYLPQFYNRFIAVKSP